MKFDSIKDVIIKNYKGIDYLEFSPKNINIIVGPNNTGKSSLLSAISLNLFALNEFRSNDLDSHFDINSLLPFNHQIYDNNKNKSFILLNIQNNDNNTISLKLEINYSNENLPNNINREAFSEYTQLNIKDLINQDLNETYRRYKFDDLTPEIMKRRTQETEKIIYKEYHQTFRETLFFKLLNDNNILIESLIQKPFIYKGRYSPIFPNEISFKVYYENNDLLESLKKNQCRFIYRSQSKEIAITQYFHELSNSPKFYDVLDTLKKKIYYLYDIREVEGDINIIIKTVDNRKIFVPFKLMGEGFQSLLIINILFELFSNGIVLLEEPENCLHPGYMDILADSIISKCQNHQFFFSTHSLELIELIIKKAEKTKNLDNILILRLSRNENKIDREILLKDDFLEELNEIKVDLRGY